MKLETAKTKTSILITSGKVLVWCALMALVVVNLNSMAKASAQTSGADSFVTESQEAESVAYLGSTETSTSEDEMAVVGSMTREEASFNAGVPIIIAASMFVGVMVISGLAVLKHMKAEIPEVPEESEEK